MHPQNQKKIEIHEKPTTLRIGIDASRYHHPEATGVEWYSYHLLNELIPLLGRDHHHEVRLYAPTDFSLEFELPFNVKKRIIPFARLWTMVRLSWEMITHPVDVLFVPSHTFPLIVPKRAIITIHDVAFHYFPKAYGWFSRVMLERSTRKAVRKATRIIVPSQSTKDDLIKWYTCPAEKIVIIPHGGPKFHHALRWPDGEKEKLTQQFSIDQSPFILYIGRLETRKNLVRLVEAFQRFLVEFPDWKLILAGKRGLGFEVIWEKVKELKLEQSVIAPGYITEREKTFLLEHCRIFAFPSLYEGFGFPVLEAFSHRKPVLTSKTSSIPEVAGDAAYLVNPERLEELSVGLKRLASDGILTSKFIQKSEIQLEKFSWEKAAERTRKVITE